MTILEAKQQYMKNIYVIKRKKWELDFAEIKNGILVKYDYYKGKYIDLTKEDIESEDWEIKKINFGRIS